MACINDIYAYFCCVLSSFLSFFKALTVSLSGLIIVVPAAIVDGHDHLNDHDSHKIP